MSGGILNEAGVYQDKAGCRAWSAGRLNFHAAKVGRPISGQVAILRPRVARSRGRALHVLLLECHLECHREGTRPMLKILRASSLGAADLDDWDELVQEDRVHRLIYTDPAIFGAELTNIWGGVWVSLGHE